MEVINVMSLRFSESEFADYEKRAKRVIDKGQIITGPESFGPVLHLVAKGSPEPPRMNKTESAYSNLLEARKRAGEIAWYRFEGVTLKLAHDTRYTPDFAVMLSDGTMEMHETKGFMRDDANVKLNIAAEMFPFRFFLIRKEKGEWDIRQIKK
jgi:hypothetical protein